MPDFSVTPHRSTPTIPNKPQKGARVTTGGGGGGAGGGRGGGGEFIEGEAAREMAENVEYLLVGRDGEEDDDQVGG